MTLYLKNGVQRPPLSKIPDGTLGHRIIEALVSKGDGQFLWTHLMVESLEKAPFLSEINQILNDVPRGLDQLYSRILEKLLTENHRRQKAAQLLLKWLALIELATAPAVRPGAAAIDPDDRLLDLIGFLEEACGSLVKISEPSDNGTQRVVTFLHLISCQGPQTASYHLLDYAAMFWVRHLAHSGRPTIDPLRRLQLFLQSDELLAYIEWSVALDNAGLSVSNLLVSQKLLNDWIGQCNSQDPRLALVIDCFRLRLEEAVQRRKETFGSDHSETLEAQFKLAQLPHYRGQWAQSAALHRQVLDGRIRTTGEQDPVTLKSVFLIASVLTRLGNHDESKRLHEQALHSRRVLLGINDPDTLLCEDGLSKTLREQGFFEEAEALSRSTLVMKNRGFWRG
ncbi:MAG: hypothetical protein Q9166_006198 [cf. Caloplaca sp. 2 TL-2023]